MKLHYPLKLRILAYVLTHALHSHLMSVILYEHVISILRTCGELEDSSMKKLAIMQLGHLYFLDLITVTVSSQFFVLKIRKKLQSIQNRAARLVFSVGRRVHTSPLIKELHWLPFSQRVMFKLCLYFYKLVNRNGPSYLVNTIALYTPARNLRSMNDTTKLVISRSNLSIAEKRFSIAGSRLWNTLPSTIRTTPTISSFKRQLKSYLFPNT